MHIQSCCFANLLLFCRSLWRHRSHCITALFKNTWILKFKSQLTIAFFTAVNHLNGPLRKQNFTLTSSKDQVCDLWLVDFNPFCVFLCFKVLCLWSQLWLTAVKNAIVKSSFELKSMHVCEKCSREWWRTRLKPLYMSFYGSQQGCPCSSGETSQDWLGKQWTNACKVNNGTKPENKRAATQRASIKWKVLKRCKATAQ